MAGPRETCGRPTGYQWVAHERPHRDTWETNLCDPRKPIRGPRNKYHERPRTPGYNLWHRRTTSDLFYCADVNREPMADPTDVIGIRLIGAHGISKEVRSS